MRSGAIRQCPYRIFDRLRGEDAFVGCRSIFDYPEEEELAVVELPTLNVRWKFVLAAQPFDRFDAALATPDAVIAKHGSGHIPATVVCFSRFDGAIRWSTTVADPSERRGARGFFMWRDLLIMNAGPMVALRVADGAVAWTLEVPLEQWFASGDIVWGTQYAAFGAFDLQTRSMRFLVKAADFKSAPSPPPRQPTWPSRAFVAGDEILMVNMPGGRLWGLDARTGRPRWLHRPPGGVSGLLPVLTGDRLIVQGPRLFCYAKDDTA